jgi:hypothetical protein
MNAYAGSPVVGQFPLKGIGCRQHLPASHYSPNAMSQPPFEVRPPEANEVVFRLVDRRNPGTAQFLSDEADGRTATLMRTSCVAIYRGFSARNTLAQARSLAKLLGKRWIAGLRVAGIARSRRARAYYDFCRVHQTLRWLGADCRFAAPRNLSGFSRGNLARDAWGPVQCAEAASPSPAGFVGAEDHSGGIESSKERCRDSFPAARRCDPDVETADANRTSIAPGRRQ